MLRHPYENKNETVNKSCAVKVADVAICADEEKKYPDKHDTLVRPLLRHPAKHAPSEIIPPFVTMTLLDRGY